MILSKMILRSPLGIIGILILMGCSPDLPTPATPTRAPRATPVPIPSVTPTRVPTPTTAPSPTSQPTEPPMPVRVMGMSFADPSHGWMLGNRGNESSMTVAVASTDDGGKSWQPLPLPPDLDPAYEWEVLSQIRGGIYFVTATDGWLFYRSLYSTRDGGLTWTYEPVDGTITQMGRAADGTVWALERHYDDWSVKQVAVAPYRQWRELIPNVITRMDGMSLTLADAKHAWVSHRGAEYKLELMATEDGGTTWHSLSSLCEYGDASVVAVGAHTLWYACGGGGAGPWGDKLILKTNDGGRTWAVKGWTPMGPPYDGATVSAFGYFIGFGAVSPSFAYMSLAHTLGPLITRDGGTTWEYLKLGCTGGEFHQVFFTDMQHGWAFYQTCVNRTVDGGKTWTCTELPDNRPCPD